jgi:hypothetical protein
MIAIGIGAAKRLEAEVFVEALGHLVRGVHDERIVERTRSVLAHRERSRVLHHRPSRARSWPSLCATIVNTPTVQIERQLSGEMVRDVAGSSRP